MEKNITWTPKQAKTEVSWFYLIRHFPFITLFHYFFAFLSGFINIKIIGKVTGIVTKAFKKGSILPIKEGIWGLIGRVMLWGTIVVVHIAIGLYLEEIYSSFLRRKLNKKYLKSNFVQTQKTKFVLGNYESDAIVVGTKASQIFNRSFYSVGVILMLFWQFVEKGQFYLIPLILLALIILTLTALALFRLTYPYRLRRLYFIQNENKRFEEIKNNIEYIKVVGAEGREIKKSRQFLKENWKNIFYLSVTKSLYASIPNYVILEILPTLFLLLLVGKSVKFLLLFSFSLKELFGAWKKLFEMFWAYGGYDTYCSSLKQLNEAFTILEKEADFPVETAEKMLLAAKPNITFQNITFSYPNTNKKILDNFSFAFQKGKRYAIIGPNGIGKSTLFKLIVKLYQPQQGVIKLDNNELEKINNSTLREGIVYLPNNPAFFNTNLGNNIVYPDIYQESIHQPKLENIVKKLGIKEFINQLPDRWETIIAEKGQNLSEGQKQLVSLMRAWVRDYKIYLFDEFLSNIASELKKKILPKLFHELKDKIIIIISHDEEVLKYVDEIYRFTAQKLEVEKKN